MSVSPQLMNHMSGLTAKVPKPRHVLLREDLRMFKARAQRRNIGFGERSLEGVQNDAVSAIANRVDVLCLGFSGAARGRMARPKAAEGTK